jgi:hypothetical protein
VAAIMNDGRETLAHARDRKSLGKPDAGDPPVRFDEGG